MINRDMVQQLIDTIQAEGTAQFCYYDGDKCYCAVGHAARLGGMDFEQVIANDIIGMKSVLGPYWNYFEPYLEDYGLSFEEWRELQHINDYYPYAGTRKGKVVEYLSKLITDPVQV